MTRMSKELAYGQPSISQRQALAIAARNGGSLVRIERVYRASFSPGAEKVRLFTVQSLIARGLLERAGEKLVRLTVAGEAVAADAQHREASAEAAVKSRREKRAAASKGPRKPHAGLYSSTNQPAWRLPYADN